MAFALSSIKPEVLDGIAAWYSDDGVLTSKGFYKNYHPPVEFRLEG